MNLHTPCCPEKTGLTEMNSCCFRGLTTGIKYVPVSEVQKPKFGRRVTFRCVTSDVAL